MSAKNKSLKDKISNLFKFFKTDLWRIQLDELPKKRSFLIRLIRIIVLAFRGFVEDKVQLRASALTYYSLLSIIPVAAMAFGIAKGFGFEKKFEKQLEGFISNRFSYEAFSDTMVIDTSSIYLVTDSLKTERLEESISSVQNVISSRIIEFSNNMLETAKGGLLAGIGVIILMWAVMKVLGNIEESFNGIWQIKKSRGVARKFTDYISFMLIGPILALLSSSASVYITTQVKDLTRNFEILDYISPFIFFLIKLIPYVLIWLLFTLLYIIMPNTKVNLKSGIIAGLIAGTVFQAVQWVYIYFQIGVSRFGAIYGGFAALPLFLIWLHISWIIVLFGAEISFATQNVHNYEYESDSKNISYSFKKLIILLISNLVIKHFEDGEKPLSAPEISGMLKIPIRVVRTIIHELVECDIFTEIQSDKSKERSYQPALDINKISIDFVLDKIEAKGSSNINVKKTKEYNKISDKLDNFKALITDSPDNLLLKDI